MSHEGEEVRRARPDRSDPAGAGWPGPGGLGAPGTEEFPVPQEARGEDEDDAPVGPDEWPGPNDKQADDKLANDKLANDKQGNGEVLRERDEYLQALLRLQADFDNYRKRVQRQQSEIFENAASSLVKKLLPVLDTADLALAHGGGEDVKQVAGALFDILSKEGLERIDPEGLPFDPAHHDAVAHEPAAGDDAPERPEVSEVLRAGYRWKGQVLRPAMVKVRG
jgi:molecular chaperone GrpE